MATTWQSIGSGLEVRVDDDGSEALVSQPGDADDGEVRALLSTALGGEWTRRTEWSAAQDESDVTARWVRA
jgi:hypothetical protein